MRVHLAAFIAMIFSSPALAQAPDCKAVADPAQRLRCFDESTSPQRAQPLPAAAAKPASPAEDPLIAKAKAAVRKQLREPASARFTEVKIKAADGKKGVCGMVNAKNGAGGMTGANFFVYDGEHAGILVVGGESTNPTSFSRDILAMTVSNGMKKYEIFCGKI